LNYRKKTRYFTLPRGEKHGGDELFINIFQKTKLLPSLLMAMDDVPEEYQAKE